MVSDLNASEEFGKTTAHRQEKSLLCISGQRSSRTPGTPVIKRVPEMPTVTLKTTLYGAEGTRTGLTAWGTAGRLLGRGCTEARGCPEGTATSGLLPASSRPPPRRPPPAARRHRRHSFPGRSLPLSEIREGEAVIGRGLCGLCQQSCTAWSRDVKEAEGPVLESRGRAAPAVSTSRGGGQEPGVPRRLRPGTTAGAAPRLCGRLLVTRPPTAPGSRKPEAGSRKPGPLPGRASPSRDPFAYTARPLSSPPACRACPASGHRGRRLCGTGRSTDSPPGVSRAGPGSGVRGPGSNQRARISGR
ncbi:uncharacterized protein AAEQ78_026269 [Lycaon pictus]